MNRYFLTLTLSSPIWRNAPSKGGDARALWWVKWDTTYTYSTFDLCIHPYVRRSLYLYGIAELWRIRQRMGSWQDYIPMQLLHWWI
jgi:hypothetical protein